MFGADAWGGCLGWMFGVDVWDGCLGWIFENLQRSFDSILIDNYFVLPKRYLPQKLII